MAYLRHIVASLLFSGAVCAQDAVALLKKLDEGFSNVFERVAPSVVLIECTKSGNQEPPDETRGFDLFLKDPDAKREPSDRPLRIPDPPSQSEGSGFILRPDGYIVTNLHVVADAEKIEVRTYDGKRRPGRLVASDDGTDIAVIKVEAAGLPPVTFGDSDSLRVGQLVCAIGAPYNQDFSFTCGWVSGKGRSDLLARSTSRPLFEDYVQTDAFINPGNSGGPLIDVEGRVVGMNTLVNGLGRGLAFAIPSNQLQEAANQLISSGKVRRAWLGIRTSSLEEVSTLREQFPGQDHGVVVTTVVAGSPAFNSDLQAGDLITSVDGIGLCRAHDLTRHIQRKNIGDTVQLAVSRRGQSLTLILKTGELDPDQIRLPTSNPPLLAEINGETLGLRLEDHGGDGATISAIVPKSAASRTELQVQDVVTAVNTEEISNAAEAREKLKGATVHASGKGVLINFLRGGKKMWVVIERPAQ